MKKIVFPENWSCETWYGFKRYNFTFENHKAFIVAPDYPAGDGRWSWCTVWPEAFVKRVGIVDLLEHGFYHVHIDLFALRANSECVRIMNRFQDYLISLGLAEKCCLIGMSWGGFFSLRYAEENPERVVSLYLDAPVCSAADEGESISTQMRREDICRCFEMSFEELKTSRLNPLNNLEKFAAAAIPVMAVVGEDDLSVNINSNFNILEQRMLEAGIEPKVIRRMYWGHHPHGLDETEEILAFHCRAVEAQ